MSSIEAAVKFFQSYPSWAKGIILLGLVVAFVTAVLAPRSGNDSKEARPKRVILKIRGVDDTPLGLESMVRVTAVVNGATFIYPSIAGVDWLDAGATMSSQTFDLVPAESYNVRFELFTTNKAMLPLTERFVSQETAIVLTLPFTSDYRVYRVRKEGEVVARAAHPGTSIRYSIDTAQ